MVMERMKSDGQVLGSRPHRLLAVGISFLLSLILSGTALSQQNVTGTVTAVTGGPLRGVSVRVQGTEIRTVTDANGKYTITAPPDALLNFALIGRRAVQVGVLNRAVVDVAMDPVAYLEEVTVTGYSEQRRAGITGAVASVNVESASRQTGASVLQRLDATVPGITVNASGSPGSRSTVRIRGVSSFQNNDPLYVVDGTPVKDDYINFLNPNDITSVQVLKDASAASIYGSRASNGVVVIETTRRGAQGPPQATLRVRTGMASPTRGYDDFLILNSLDYFQIVKQSYENAGLQVPTNVYGSVTNPTVPNFIWPNNCGPVVAGEATPGPCSTVNPASYSYPKT
jgi:TonB-dependent starch-binding outer membrane protein SusC